MSTIYQQYYTKSNEIVTYMLNKLSAISNSYILEPCAGDGVFIDALLTQCENIKIDAFELDMRGASLENKIFDQSIVGVFPKNEAYLYYLLAFFNSTVCTNLLRLINPSANNSANYIKKIPVIIPDSGTLIHISKLVETILILKQNSESAIYFEEILDDIFNTLFYENPNKNISVNAGNELFTLC